MKFMISRAALLRPLQLVTGVVERSQTMPILANVLLGITNQQLVMTCTDLEIELVADINIVSESATQELHAVTVPARKLLDICRALPEDAMIDFYQDNDKCMVVRSERSRFVLTPLPAESFPNIEWDTQDNVIEFTMQQKELHNLLASTQFAMAQQDVRYFLNGLLLEIKNDMLWMVAADGHRIALNGMKSPIANDSVLRVIVPRKGVTELTRLLEDSEEEVKVAISSNHIRIKRPGLVITSKLIDGKFPDYERTIPRGGDKKIIIDRDIFRQALSRVAILSSDIFCGVQLQIRSGSMHMLTRSQGQEGAEEEITINYQGEEITIGFNINYLLDILAGVHSEQILMTISNNSTSVLLEEYETEDSNKLYVVMPLHL